MDSELPRESPLLTAVKTLWDESRSKAFELVIPNFDILKRQISEIELSLLPWQRAAQAARLARDAWSLQPGPVSTSILADILSISEESLLNDLEAKGPMHAGFRNGRPDCFGVFLNKPISAGRRFALLRLVGDHLTAPQGDRLLPAAVRSKTQRQKFQRAFAQEFLCPYTDLTGYLGSADPSDEDIEEAARYFDVSPFVVETILVNKGNLDRSSLPCG